MTILIIGATGRIGSQIVKNCFKNDILLTPRLDITDINARLEIERLSPDLVINCAAFTQVDKCETDAKSAYALNTFGPENIYHACKKLKIPFIHISTDYVFSAEGNHKENAPVHPLSVYGASKAFGECRLNHLYDFDAPSLIVRVCWIYGTSNPSFPEKLLANALLKDEIPMVDDQIGKPTWAGDVAVAVEKLVKGRWWEKVSVIHFASRGMCSRFEQAKVILETAYKVTGDAVYNPAKLRKIYSSQTTGANRPTACTLDTGLYEQHHTIPDWKEAQIKYVEEIQKTTR